LVVVAAGPRFNVSPCSLTAIWCKYHFQSLVVGPASRRSPRVEGLAPDASDWNLPVKLRRMGAAVPLLWRWRLEVADCPCAVDSRIRGQDWISQGLAVSRRSSDGQFRVIASFIKSEPSIVDPTVLYAWWILGLPDLIWIVGLRSNDPDIAVPLRRSRFTKETLGFGWLNPQSTQ
jgi:hypothetical protein